MRALLRLPDFRLLFAGLATSMIGDSLLLLVLAIWVKRLTGSSGAAGLLMLFMTAPMLVAPFGGWLVDRFRRRPFLIVVNLASALALTPLFTVRDRGDVWIVYAVATLYGTSAAATTAALNGLLKEVLADDLLGAANGMLQMVKEGLRIAGPPAGAALFATTGGSTVAALDAVSFVLAAFAVARMRLREDRPERERTHLTEEMIAGIRHVLADPPLRRVTIAAAVAMSVIGITESACFALVDQGLHRPPEFIGVLSCAQGAGAIAGGLVAAWLIERAGELTATAAGLAAFAIGIGACVVTAVPAVLAGMAVLGAGLAVAVVGIATVLQRRTPAALTGRASIAVETIYGGPQIFSIVAGAVLVSLMDYRMLFAAVFAGTFAAAAYLWSGRRCGAVDRSAPSRSPVPGRARW